MNYKYQLLQKPILSGWYHCSRYAKAALLCMGFITVSSLTISRWMAHNNAASLINLQASTANMLDMELHYHSQANDANDVWKSTSIKDGNIFSAYLDLRPEVVLDYKHMVTRNESILAMIRVIGVFPTDLDTTSLACYYKYRNPANDGAPIIRRRRATSVENVAAPESFEMLYIPFFVLCDLTLNNNMNYNIRNNYLLPTEIAISAYGEDDFRDVGEFVPIHYPKGGMARALKPDKFMAVCVPSFHHNFRRVVNLIEFIEFYRMMGADHFTFYNSSISPEVSRVLDYYMENDVATVLQWNLPSYYVFDKTLRSNGIFAGLNDCLYRSGLYNGYKYVAGVDVDEFIVPRHHNNYIEMMAQLDPESSSNTASFIFRNVFFYMMYEDDPVTQSPDIPVMYLQSKTTRWTQFNEAPDRSKYIVRGQDLIEIGNHITYRRRKISFDSDIQYEENTVNPDIAASQHYRYCETNIEECWHRPTVRDTTAHKYTENLGKRVAGVCNKIFKSSCPTTKKGRTSDLTRLSENA